MHFIGQYKIYMDIMEKQNSMKMGSQLWNECSQGRQTNNGHLNVKEMPLLTHIQLVQITVTVSMNYLQAQSLFMPIPLNASMVCIQIYWIINNVSRICYLHTCAITFG